MRAWTAPTACCDASARRRRARRVAAGCSTLGACRPLSQPPSRARTARPLGIEPHITTHESMRDRTCRFDSDWQAPDWYSRTLDATRWPSSATAPPPTATRRKHRAGARSREPRLHGRLPGKGCRCRLDGCARRHHRRRQQPLLLGGRPPSSRARRSLACGSCRIDRTEPSHGFDDRAHTTSWRSQP